VPADKYFGAAAEVKRTLVARSKWTTIVNRPFCPIRWCRELHEGKQNWHIIDSAGMVGKKVAEKMNPTLEDNGCLQPDQQPGRGLWHPRQFFRLEF